MHGSNSRCYVVLREAVDKPLLFPQEIRPYSWEELCQCLLWQPISRTGSPSGFPLKDCIASVEGNPSCPIVRQNSINVAYVTLL